MGPALEGSPGWSVWKARSSELTMEPLHSPAGLGKVPPSSGRCSRQACSCSHLLAVWGFPVLGLQTPVASHCFLMGAESTRGLLLMVVYPNLLAFGVREDTSLASLVVNVVHGQVCWFCYLVAPSVSMRRVKRTQTCAATSVPSCRDHRPLLLLRRLLCGFPAGCLLI